LPRDLPLVEIDATLIERALANLLENAAKFSPKGTPIRVAARVVDTSMEVSVADEGPGIPKGQEEAIFEKFTRGEKESTTPGVGLATARAIVEAKGGKPSLDRGYRGGARFIFTLPLGSPPAVASSA